LQINTLHCQPQELEDKENKSKSTVRTAGMSWMPKSGKIKPSALSIVNLYLTEGVCKLVSIKFGKIEKNKNLLEGFGITLKTYLGLANTAKHLG